MDRWKSSRTLKRRSSRPKGPEATVKIEAPDEPPSEVKFKQVDGKWLPEQMVTTWDENIAKAKTSLAAVDPAAQKAQGMAMLSMVEGVLEQLLAAKDQEAFNNVVNSVTSMVSPSCPRPAPCPPRLRLCKSDSR